MNFNFLRVERNGSVVNIQLQRPECQHHAYGTRPVYPREREP